MIGFIQGEVISLEWQKESAKGVVLTSSGVGYEMTLPLSVSMGQKINCYCATIIREQDWTLYGFSDLQSKKMFELLLTVNSIGPKTAYTLVQTFGIEELKRLISSQDLKGLQKCSGLGRKGAEQIVLSLRDKITKHQGAAPLLTPEVLHQNLFAACEALDLKREDVLPYLGQLSSDLSTEDAIKKLLSLRASH